MAFSAAEIDLWHRWNEGGTVPVNMREHRNLWAWANTNGHAARIDRQTCWGNPFPITATDNRSQVIVAHARYIRSNEELLASIGELRGKFLGCWCAPLPCHGDLLAALASR